jgi:hypothetical protein
MRAARFAAPLLCATLLSGLVAAPASAAGTATWLQPLADPTGVVVFLQLDPDGVHHAAVVDQFFSSTLYMTDRGNRWMTATVPGVPLGMRLDGAGHVYLLTVVEGGGNEGWARLTTDASGSLVTETVPGRLRPTGAPLR